MLKNDFIFPANWLTEFKKLIRYPYDDIDDNLNSYLRISLINIATQYLNLKEENIELWFSKMISEDRFKIATFHLAATFYENPDILLTNSNGSVVDKNQIFRILGGLVNYYSGFNSTTKPLTPINDYVTKEELDIILNVIRDEILANTTNITTISSELNVVKNEFTDLENLVNSKVIQIDENTNNILINTNDIKELKTSDTTIQNNLNNLEIKVTANTDNITATNTTITKLRTDLENLESVVNLDTTLITKNINDIKNIDIQLATKTTEINTLRTDLGDLGNIVNSNTQNIEVNKQGVAANLQSIVVLEQKTTKNITDIATLQTTVAKTKKYYTLETTVVNRAGSMVNTPLNFYGFLIGIDITTFTPLRGKIKSVWPKSEPLRKATILFDVPDTTRNILWLNVIFNKTWADESYALNAAIILELEE